MPVRGRSSISRTPAALGPECLLDRLHAVGDVVKPRAAAGEELPDGGVRAERLEQLDVAFADVEQRRLDALLVHRLAVDERHPERVRGRRRARRRVESTATPTWSIADSIGPRIVRLRSRGPAGRGARPD